MGYILPITHHQYHDYHKRTTQTARSPFELNHVFKATLDSKLQQRNKRREEEHKDDQPLTSSVYTPEHFHLSPQTRRTNGEEKVFSKMTGKGGNFSETI